MHRLCKISAFFLSTLIVSNLLICGVGVFQQLGASVDTSLCCENTDYSNTEYLNCVNGKDFPTSPIANCGTCVAYQCMDWTVGSKLNAQRQAAFLQQTGQDVYFGVGSYGGAYQNDPTKGGICYRISTTTIKKDIIVQVVNYGGDVPPGNFDLQVADGGFGIYDACTSSGTKMPQFNGSISLWGVRIHFIEIL